MKRLRSLVFIVTIVLLSTSGGYANGQQSKKQIFGSPLWKIAEKNDILIGAAVEPYLLEEPQYAEILAEQFNYLTPENRMKWSFIHPEKDRYDLVGAIHWWSLLKPMI